jgi:hypothetical protein
MKAIIFTLLVFLPISAYSGGSSGTGTAGSTIQDLLLNLQEARSEALQAQQGGLVGGGTGIIWGIAGEDGSIYRVIPKNWSLFDADSISSNKVLLNSMNGVYTVDTSFTETLLDSEVFFQELDLSQVPFDQNLQILVLPSVYSLGGVGGGDGPPGIYSSNAFVGESIGVGGGTTPD